MALLILDNCTALKYIKQNMIKLKGETDKSTNIFGNFNIPFLATDRNTRKKISTSNQQDLINIYRILYLTKENTNM